jgi:Glycosyl transferases group 1
MSGRLLVLNCHEAWIHQLRHLGRPLDIVVGLPGRHTRVWDTAMRPLPANSRTITLSQALTERPHYDCIIAHNLTDLFDTRMVPAPRIFVVHLTLEGMALEQHAQTRLSEYRATSAAYVEYLGAHVVAVSKLKADSWGVRGAQIVPLSVDLADYPPWIGDLPRGLRISNFLTRRARTLLLNFHNEAFSDLPITIVGHNPELPGATPSADWADLKGAVRRHRFYIHTADPRLEDGYNMATLEAMAAGLPVVGNRHPTSPIVHGVNGFLSDTPEDLKRFAQRLSTDRHLAGEMGRAAQHTVSQRFSPAGFRGAMVEAIAAARARFRTEDTHPSGTAGARRMEMS